MSCCWVRTIYANKPADWQDYLGQLMRNLAEPGRFDPANALGGSSRQPSAERLKRMKAPTLVIMGTKDRIFPIQLPKARWLPSKLAAGWR
jgi:pimeloyl-ACP methyl ester carboxylesterase